MAVHLDLIASPSHVFPVPLFSVSYPSHLSRVASYSSSHALQFHLPEKRFGNELSQVLKLISSSTRCHAS
jgi:hypothetical protein